MKLRAFTLIELLVVIAIIGILSAIVLASLNTARDRGKEASIRSTLKNMSEQIELMRNDTADYRFVLNCQDPSNPLHTFVDSMVAQGATVRCISSSVGSDIYTRWGVSASITTASDLTAWSASSEGVVKWDIADIKGDGTPGSQSVSWNTATSACTGKNERLPTAEQFLSLWQITSPNPDPDFTVATAYWSSTEVPSNPANAYKIGMDIGSIVSYAKTSGRLIRCVS